MGFLLLHGRQAPGLDNDDDEAGKQQYDDDDDGKEVDELVGLEFSEQKFP